MLQERQQIVDLRLQVCGVVEVEQVGCLVDDHEHRALDEAEGEVGPELASGVVVRDEVGEFAVAGEAEPGGDARELFRSIRQLLSLPDEKASLFHDTAARVYRI